MASADDGRETLLFGGCHDIGCSVDGGAQSATWIFDGGGWTEHLDGGPPARTFAGMAYDGTRDELVLFGGCTAVNVCPSSVTAPVTGSTA